MGISLCAFDSIFLCYYVPIYIWRYDESKDNNIFICDLYILQNMYLPILQEFPEQAVNQITNNQIYSFYFNYGLVYQVISVSFSKLISQ